MSATPPPRFPLGFSSMGDPSLDFAETVALAEKHDLQFLELRVLEGNLDLPDYFSQKPPAPLPPNLRVAVLSSSLRLIEATEADFQEFARYIDLAKTLQASYIRVFGGGAWGEEIPEAAINQAAHAVETLRAMAHRQGWSGEVLLETHSGFSSSQTCARLNERLAQPIHLIWDTHHTWKIAGESVEESWARIGSWTRHLHVKDSVSDATSKDGYHYVPPGAGEYPAQILKQVLTAGGYTGGISLEWEKLWHSELAPLAAALPPFVEVYRGA